MRPVQPPNALPRSGHKLMPEESTSADLVEFTRRSVEAANRGDFDALLRGYAPDVVWDLNPLGGFMTSWASPSTAEMAETLAGDHRR
jgi:hypothetical protein